MLYALAASMLGVQSKSEKQRFVQSVWGNQMRRRRAVVGDGAQVLPCKGRYFSIVLFSRTLSSSDWVFIKEFMFLSLDRLVDGVSIFY